MFLNIINGAGGICVGTVTLIAGGELRTLRDCGGDLRALLLRCGYITDGVCGGNGSCGRCRVRYISGAISGDAPDENGTVRACRTIIGGDTVFALPRPFPSGEPQAPGISGDGCGIAVDLGTTTLVCEAYSTGTGELLGRTVAPNPQRAWGADVISRITASSGGALKSLSEAVRGALRDMFSRLCRGSPDKAVIAGNTVMLHLLRGMDPTPLGTYPYTPAYSGAYICPGGEIGLPAESVVLLPHVSAYVGGDITAGMLALGFDRLPAGGTSAGNGLLLCDLGTNGELALARDGVIRCTSAAAGPAFEGGGTECGGTYAPGAVEHVGLGAGGDIILGTVPGAPPGCICGSGLLDAVLLMLRLGVIDGDGGFIQPPARVRERLRDGKFYLTDSLYISQRDIRQFQLAKSAVRSAAGMLCGGSAPDGVAVCGSFGAGADIQSLQALGVLPPGWKNLRAEGNTSLRGAVRVLLEPDALSRASAIAEAAGYDDLSLDPGFQKIFINNLRIGN